jgi:signal transduction histidine kinase
MMVNMKKHSQATLVVIDFVANRKKIEINYTDNGRGATDKQLFLKNGLSNIENRMASINGNSKFDSDAGEGFYITLTYPV